jgi:hypothetical protein
MTRRRVTHQLRAWVPLEIHNRVAAESAARGLNFSRTICACLEEYFATREELATSLEIRPPSYGEPKATIIHTLLARTEERLSADLHRQLQAVERRVRRLEVMLEEHYLGMMIFLPGHRAPESEENVAIAGGRYKAWRRAVEETVRAIDAERSRPDQK